MMIGMLLRCMAVAADVASTSSVRCMAGTRGGHRNAHGMRHRHYREQACQAQRDQVCRGSVHRPNIDPRRPDFKTYRLETHPIGAAAGRWR